MISNSIRTGSFKRAHVYPPDLTWRKMCLSNNFCHSHIKSVSHRVQLCRYHWPFFLSNIAMMVSHTFLTLPYSYIQNTIDYLRYMTRLFTPSLIHISNEREREKKPISNQEDYFFIFALKTIKVKQG